MNHLVSFGWADTCILVIILASMLISFFRGFIREAISLVVWVAAVVFGMMFADSLGGHFAAHIDSPTMRFILAFITIFIGVIVLGMVVNAVVRMLLDKTGLSIFDRLLGVIFGFARGVLVVAMLLMFVGMSAMKNDTWVKDSWTAKTLHPLVGWLDGFVPEHVSQVSSWVSKGLEKVPMAPRDGDN
jgi:membrane protein required for colicin V production